MSKYTNPLEHVRVAAPCPADWGKMVGDERMRYCERCSLHVYNLSGMTRREAEALVTSAEGRLCVRFYRRADGTILTRNCPVGLSALKRRATRAAAATFSAVLGFFAGLGLNFGSDRALAPEIMDESAVPAPRIPAPDKGYIPDPGLREVLGGMAFAEQGEAAIEYPVVGRLVREPRTYGRQRAAPLVRDRARLK